MYKFNKILVGLDQTDMDFELIDAACKMCQMSDSQEVIFMSLLRDFQLPIELLQQFPDILDKAIAEREANLRASVERYFTCPDVRIQYVVRQGQPTREIMKASEEEKVDLVILGRKNERKEGGILLSRLARRAACSLLVIPKGHKMKLDRLFVPSDFSSYSTLALEKAVELAHNIPSKPQIAIQNVYQVPSGYHYSGKTYEEFAELMQQYAKKDYQQVVSGIDFGGLEADVTYTLDREDDVLQYIHAKAMEIQADMLIIGAKGRTSATAIFIGSKAEKLIHLDSKCALLVVRPKGKTAGIREYLQEL
ncbi:MAG: universal stress protein [Bacteroidota bacterium]